MGAVKVRGAAEANLRSIHLDLPLGRLVVFTGPSGSGKSSLAFDTLHAEAQRRYLNAFSHRMRGLLRSARRPAYGSIEGLPPTIALDQRPRRHPRDMRVSDAAGLGDVLRLLWGRGGKLHCPGCDEPVRSWTHDEVVGEILRHPEGCRMTLEAPAGEARQSVLDAVQSAGFSRVRVNGEVVRVEDCAPDPEVSLRVVIDRVRIHPDRRARLYDAVRLALDTGKGVMVAVTDEGASSYSTACRCHACGIDLPPLEPRLLDVRGPAGRCRACEGTGADGEGSCAGCGGSGLSEVSGGVQWAGRRFEDVWRQPLSAWSGWLKDQTPDEVAVVPYEALVRRVEVLIGLGLSEVALGQHVHALSAGEVQRLRLARQVSSDLSGVLYVLDEPTAGLDDAHAACVADLLRQLVRSGNSVLCVEHHAAVVAVADHLVEFGPGAGEAGGQVVFEGDLESFREADTPGGRWWRGELPTVPTERRRGATTFTLRAEGSRRPHVDLAFPVERLVAITGPNASGKSLVLRALADQWARGDTGRTAIWIDGNPAQVARSNVATYTGLWTLLRKLLSATREAQVRGFKPGVFSLAKRGGRCEGCAGEGTVAVDLDFLPRVSIPCEVCQGRRFMADVLQVRWRGHAPDQLLGLTVDSAHRVLAGHPKLERVLRALRDVGLGYLTLGQSLASLSGGEARRLHLAKELTRLRGGNETGTAYLIEHPEVGLHAQDLQRQVGVLQHLVEEGATVWFTTHRPELVAAADEALTLDRAPGEDTVHACWRGRPS